MAWIKLIFIPFILGFFFIVLITLIVNGVRDNKPFVNELQIDCHPIFHPNGANSYFEYPCTIPSIIRSE